MNTKVNIRQADTADIKEAPTPVNQTMVEAINLALAHAMEEDENVVMLGEDVGANGGVFRATVDLRQEFGLKRVMDTPLAETLISGITIGMASQGLKPIAEIQFMGFIYAAMEQIVSHASRLRNRTRGRISCPMVIRAPFGGGIHAPEHHSESTEALFAHIPGIRVVVPSSPLRAYGLLLSAIRDPDPVLFLEPKRIYRAVAQPVLDDGKALPLDTCFTLREGSDLTLISWGAMIQETLQAANTLSEKGVSCEVIDVASISPLDTNTLECSAVKTGRCIIIHEAAHSGGVGAEIAAHLAEHCLLDLKAPIKRVTGFDTIMPYLRNEGYYLPSVERIVDAANEVMDF
ncbi:alpha-ketoacid dehydrogenase subunit beta [Alkalimarinus alittae]|uniref:Alpha-ketoacid dehydrogenase subunit beta n=1 Tax=Alkalimarinus alittae TaxID=2961619 RepID=A0ABY6N382_9ALTE|nr:alpha-ketoacid dehydrogenase subunit beta [Alkalimarinus alittae]UZE96480.1 alpha-ketoacid dehydrogenase subunit beta [Alkalimarinus alittae]